jgi:hypothetical protein
MRMAMRIRVTTRADLFEKRKQQHIERGYQIEDERPIDCPRASRGSIGRALEV